MWFDPAHSNKQKQEGNAQRFMGAHFGEAFHPGPLNLCKLNNNSATSIPLKTKLLGNLVIQYLVFRHWHPQIILVSKGYFSEGAI